jgi:replication initiation protein RepC
VFSVASRSKNDRHCLPSLFPERSQCADSREVDQPRRQPYRRRWGQRDAKTGKIIEAYGFDLSPIGLRHDEFIAIAERAAIEERERAALRRRLTIARKAIQQIAETALEHQLTDRNWHYWLAEALTLALTIPGDLPLDQLQAVIGKLEQRRVEGEAALRAAFDSQQNAPAAQSSAPL